MRRWPAAAILASTLALLAPAAAQAAYSERSVGSPEQIAWVRAAAHRFLAGELAANGAETCAVLTARLRATIHGRPCERRWHAHLVGLLREHGARARLRSEQRAVASARVVVHGDVASIELPAALLHGRSVLRWTENCWMLEG
jgi:hypothetical protein